MQGSTDTALALQENMHLQLANTAQMVMSLGDSSQPVIDQLADAITNTMDVESRLMHAVTDRLMARQAIAAFKTPGNAFGDISIPSVNVQRSNGKLRLSIQAQSVTPQIEGAA